MVVDGNWVYCGDHFALYTNIKSLHSMPETDILLHPFFKKDCSIKIVCTIPSKVAIHIALYDGSFLTVYVPNVGENDSLIELDFFP